MNKKSKKAAVSAAHEQAIQHWQKKKEDRDHIIKVTSEAKPDGESTNQLFARRPDLVAMTAK